MLARLRAGESVSPDEFYMPRQAVFDAPDGPYAWLAERLFVCSLLPKGRVVTVDVYEVL